MQAVASKFTNPGTRPPDYYDIRHPLEIDNELSVKQSRYIVSVTWGILRRVLKA